MSAVSDALLRWCQPTRYRAPPDNLHLVQPALSLQIKHIEQELGVTLFDRTPKDVMPTAAGMRFLSHARDILRRLEVAIGLPQSIDKILTVPLVADREFRLCRNSGVTSAYGFPQYCFLDHGQLKGCAASQGWR